MQTDLYKKYEGPAAFNAESVLLNAIQVQVNNIRKIIYSIIFSYLLTSP